MIFSSRFKGKCSTHQLSLKVQMRLRMYYRTILVIILSIFLLYLFWPNNDSFAWRLSYFRASQKNDRIECYDINDNYVLLKSLDAARDANSGVKCYEKLLRDACLLEKSMLLTTLDNENDSNECDIVRGDELQKHTLQDFIIAFIILVTNDEYHQIERLFINIYAKKHIYFFYVCNACSFTYERLKKHLKPNFHNIQVERIFERQNLLEAWKSIIHRPFDCVVNLDQYDFPLASIDRLEFYLYKNYGVNIIDKPQQVDNVIMYSTCSNNNRYKIGYGNLPCSFNIKSLGKFVLTRTFINYLMKNSTLVHHSFINSQYMQFPEQHFIANVLENWKCSRKMYTNLFLDSSGLGKWNFDQSDFRFIYGLMSSNNSPYFIRKVDPRYNQQIINDIESTFNPFFGDLHLGFIPVNTTLRDYWSPIPRMSFEPSSDCFSQFLKQMLYSKIDSRCRGARNQSHYPLRLLQGHMLNQYDLVEGMDLKFVLSCLDVPVTFEALVSKNLTTIRNHITNNRIVLSSSEENNTSSVTETVPNPLISAAVVLNVNGSQSSYFFRNAMSVFYDTDQLSVRTKWEIGKKDLVVDIIAIDPHGQVSLPFQFEIGPTNETVLIPLLLKSTKRRIPTGLWQLQIFDIENLLVELTFYILPTTNTFNTTFDQQAGSNNMAMWYKVLSEFYFIRDMCVSSRHATNYKRYCKCQKVRLPICESGTTWSSAKKDLKSDAIEMLL